MKDIIQGCLNSLAQRRPLFHSEADFQFEFAWELRGIGISTRLEVPIQGVGEVDLIIPVQTGIARDYFIEFKYKTKEFHCGIESESFHLKGHSAHPLGRYDFIKDIERIEQSGKPGCAIFMTNDPLYWKAGGEGNGEDFSLREERKISGNLTWRDSSKTNSIGKGRVSPIKIDGKINCYWQDYSCVGKEKFRCLVAGVMAE